MDFLLEASRARLPWGNTGEGDLREGEGEGEVLREGTAQGDRGGVRGDGSGEG